MQRSLDDLLAVLDAPDIRKAVLLGTSCAGQVQTLFASQHPDRVSGLVYLDGASDPTTTATEYEPAMPDLETLPRQSAPMDDLDSSSFEAYRRALRRTRGFAFPEAELRQGFAANPHGSWPQKLPPQKQASAAGANSSTGAATGTATLRITFRSTPPRLCGSLLWNPADRVLRRLRPPSGSCAG